ncbi:glycosyltransferase family 2 protein [Fontivita pretiosa]|uniref:glycosyltransferase family 2 protein n=1 Tax=Fontivita pretiosa TaxID=2989684 RepID=UPI003D1716CB
MSRALPRFSFGMIVFNGEYFLRQVLDGVYDFAHEIVVVEGADQFAMPLANPDGSSTDRTWEILCNYPDPKGKIQLLRGRWADKDQQSNAFMPYLSGDFVWLLDSDEMYQPQDMERIARALHDDPELMAVQMRHRVFFGGLDRVAHGRHWENTFWRIHRLYPGARYISHRPVNIMHPTSGRTMNEMKHLSADMLDQWGIRMYHYSYVLDKQVEEKIRYHCYWRPTRYPRERDVHYFHYDYIQKIWRPWKLDRRRIEAEYGISPNIYRDAEGQPIKDKTLPFVGEHPPAMRTHPLYRQTYGQSDQRRAA